MHLDDKILNKIKVFDAFSLKVLAMIAMLTDHIGAVLFPQYIVLRIIGRLAFPIYCFLLANGAVYTKNIVKYSARLLLFGVISEIPFDLAVYGTIFEWSLQNVFFTLFLGMVGIMIARSGRRLWWLSIVPVLVAEYIHTDYGAIGVLYILLFYLLYESKLYKMFSFAVVTTVAYAQQIQMYCLFSIIPMLLYNGKKGINVKYFFYIFYPAHLLVLYLIVKLIR